MQITEYRIPAPVTVTAAIVSDLHEHDPSPVLEALEALRPDMIAAVGDILERNTEGKDPRNGKEYRPIHRILRNTAVGLDKILFGRKQREDHSENAYRFFREASRIAPVFYSRGNHEWYLTEKDRAFLAETGVTLLENSDCQWNGIRIGGMNPATDLEWLRRFEQKDGWKLLLCHHPEYYKRFLGGTDIDLIFSGHAHGGQIRVGRQGIFSTGQGIFPKYTKGVYDGKLVVSAGCANTASFPRFGNPTEVVAVHLEKG